MYPSKPCLNITSSRKPSLFLVKIQHFMPCTPTEGPCWLVAHILPLAPLVFVYTWFPCVTACFPRPRCLGLIIPNRPEAGFHLKEMRNKTIFPIFFLKKDNLKWQGSMLRKILFGNYWYYLLQTFHPHIHTSSTGPLNSMGRRRVMAYFAVCLYVDVQTPLLCSPPSIIECLKKKNQLSRCVWAVWSWDWDRNESIWDSDYGAEEKKNLNRSSVEGKV